MKPNYLTIKASTMKPLMSLLIATLIVATAWGQAPIKLVKERVGNPDILKNWKVGETKYVNEVEITRLEGENNYDELTNLFYTPPTKIMGMIGSKADLENLTASESNEMTDFYQKTAPGGQIALFFCRTTKIKADPGNFTITIKDKTDNVVICLETLDKETPYYYKWGIWYYYKTINVPEQVGKDFIVQVHDKGINSEFKFLIENNPDGILEVEDLLTNK